LKQFSRAVVEAFKDDWLRSPNAEEISRIEGEYAALGFPGCIGCVYCASWEWDKCPVAWQGQYRGKDKKSCCRMEVVCDDYLFIWHVMFGTAGSKNDINILNTSPFFNAN
jgi:Plant transposon protein